MSDEVSVKTSSFDICCECKTSCCQDAKPPLTKNRKKVIVAYLRRQGVSIKQPFTDATYTYPTVDGSGFCVFYSKSTKECLIHAVKPETCRAGPITFDINCATGKLEFFLKKSEICTFAPKLFQDRGKFKKHFEVAKREIIRLIRSLDASALLAVLKVEEPQTFKIGEAALPKNVASHLRVETCANEK